MSSEGPLSDLTVVELTVHRAGPYCGAFLSDMGADVVKIERPAVGDPSRHIGPGPRGRSAYFIANNRGKRSVTLDLKTNAGREAALELIADADVVVENFALGVPEKLGLGYEAARAVNEEVVYASIKGYGETGDLKAKKGLDLIIQAESGIMSVTGPKGGHPVKVGTSIVDMSTGLLATIGILAKLHERDQGRGPGSEDPTPNATGKFDVALLDMAVSLMNAYPTQYEMTGEVPGPQGVAHQTAVPYQLFDTADGEIITGVASDPRWDEFVDVLGREELREYDSNHKRVEHKDRVLEICQDEFAQHSTAYWLDVLTEAGFPNAPLNDVADITEYEQLRERGVLQNIADPDDDEVVVPGLPIHFPDFDARVDRHAPRLGEHTREVFEAIAPDQTTLDDWTENGAFD